MINASAVARQGTGLVVASSTDAGGSWRRTTVVTVPYRTPELALVAGIGGSAYLVVTRTLPAGEPGVVQVWRNAGRSWTRLVDYSRSISSTPKFTTAVGVPTIEREWKNWVRYTSATGKRAAV